MSATAEVRISRPRRGSTWTRMRREMRRDMRGMARNNKRRWNKMTHQVSKTSKRVAHDTKTGTTWAAKKVGHYARRGTGVVLYGLFGIVSWTWQAISTVLTSVAVAIGFGVIGLAIGVGWLGMVIGLPFDKYVVGTSKWMSQRHQGHLRTYVNNRSGSIRKALALRNHRQARRFGFSAADLAVRGPVDEEAEYPAFIHDEGQALWVEHYREGLTPEQEWSEQDWTQFGRDPVNELELLRFYDLMAEGDFYFVGRSLALQEKLTAEDYDPEAEDLWSNTWAEWVRKNGGNPGEEHMFAALAGYTSETDDIASRQALVKMDKAKKNNAAARSGNPAKKAAAKKTAKKTSRAKAG